MKSKALAFVLSVAASTFALGAMAQSTTEAPAQTPSVEQPAAQAQTKAKKHVKKVKHQAKKAKKAVK